MLSFQGFDLHNTGTMRAIVILLFISLVIYFGILLCASWRKVKFRILFVVVSLIHCSLLVVPFLTSNDLYSYIASSRVWARWGQNPYVSVYDSLPKDEFYQSIRTVWTSERTLYGPLFLFLGGGVNILGKSNLVSTIMLFKLSLIGANLINSFLIYKISKSTKSFFAYAANPIIIFELAGNTHTESVLIMFFLLSIYMLARKATLAFLSMSASFLIKYSTLILLPLLIIFIFKKRGMKTVGVSLLLASAVIICCYAPFWKGEGILEYLLAYYNGRYISPSLGIWIGEKILGSYQTSFNLNTLLFLVVYGWLCLKYLFSKPRIKKLIFYSFLIYWCYLLTKLSLVMVWYLTPLIALASICLSNRKQKRWATVGLVFASIYSLGLYYFVR